MNFRFTRWKIIGSVVIAIILLVLFNLLTCMYVISPPNIAKPSCPSLFENTSAIYVIIGLLLVYIIWSLFEKKVEKGVKKKRK